MRRGAEFTLTVRTGTRAGRPSVVGHMLVRTGIHEQEPARVGFVVSRAVGPAVTQRAGGQVRELYAFEHALS